MKKTDLIQRTNENISRTGQSIQTIWDNINKGQQKQLIKIPEVKEILDRYGVNYEK